MISPRTPKTEAAYQAFKQAKLKSGADLSAFNLAEEIVLREFKHWLIIANRFPYDNMTSVNHMLIPRRPIKDFTDATAEELVEHQKIKNLLIEESFYDALVENLPRSKSVQQHAHVHLVCWKYTAPDGHNLSDSQPAK